MLPFLPVMSTNGDITGHHGGDDIWQIKLSASGDLIWERCLGGSLDEHLSSMLEASDGSIVSVGFTLSSDGDVSGKQGNQDMWFTIIKD